MKKMIGFITNNIEVICFYVCMTLAIVLLGLVIVNTILPFMSFEVAALCFAGFFVSIAYPVKFFETIDEYEETYEGKHLAK